MEGDILILDPAAMDAAGGPGLLRRVYHSALARPTVYDFLQRHGGGVPIAARVRTVLAGTAGRTVLDVGAGTGMVADILPSEARYVWLDNDRLKLTGFIAKGVPALTILGDAAQLPFRDAAVDVVTMVEVAHHLPDEAFSAFLSEAARVTGERFVLADGLRTGRLRSRILWALDLGRHPRTDDELQAALSRCFEIREIVRFRVNHDHVIYDCVPRKRPVSADSVVS